MTTPTDPPHEDTPVDGRVRALLWRLRARLVVPPDAQRVDQDLERILAAAAELRQDQPEAHLEGPQGAHGVGDEGASGPIPISSTPEPVRLRQVESLAARRESKLPYSVSRVAAVAVLIVGVAGGLATAMDRDGTILALLGADSRAPIDTTESTTSHDDADIPDRDAAFDSSDGDDTDGGADQASGSAERVEAVEGSAEGEEHDESSDTDGSSSSGRSDGNGSEEEGTDDGERTGEQREEPAETVEEPDDTVIAAPDPEDPGELDGFGGPAPCPEDSLRDCAPEDGEEGSEEPPATETADEDADETDGDDDADADDAADGDPFKELASRRYRP